MVTLVLVLAWAMAPGGAQATTVPAPHATTQTQTLPEQAFLGRTPGQITRRLASGEGDIHLPDQVESGERVFVGGSFGRLTNSVCRARLIVVGTLVSVETRLNADASSLYSEWQVRVAEPIKPHGSAGAASTVSVFMRGGTRQFGDRAVHVANRDFHSGLEPGAEFLLFAARLPGSGALVATTGFRLDDATVRRASRRSIHPEAERLNRDELLQTVADLVTRTSDNPDCTGGPR